MIRNFTGLLLLAIAVGASAEPCTDNFSAEGSLLTGKTFKSWALLPGVRPQDAFVRAYAFTAENGFTVLSSNKEAGVISAAQSVSYGKGKTVPLTVTLRQEGDGTRIAINYATSFGLISPEDAIKRHFCMTIAAAGGGSGDSPNVAATASAPGRISNASDDTRRAPRPASPRGYAELSPAQHEAAVRELTKASTSSQVRELAKDAAPAITSFVERISCLADYSGASALEEFAAPGANMSSLFMVGPIHNAHYHNKAVCMTVARMQGWIAPANNALRFEVLYKADDSGETVKMNHEAVRQPDGSWLFTH